MRCLRRRHACESSATSLPRRERGLAPASLLLSYASLFPYGKSVAGQMFKGTCFLGSYYLKWQRHQNPTEFQGNVGWLEKMAFRGTWMVFFIVDRFWMKSTSSCRVKDGEGRVAGMEGGRSQGRGRGCGVKQDCSHRSKSSHNKISSRTGRKILGSSPGQPLFFVQVKTQGWLLRAHSPRYAAPSWAPRDSPSAAMSVVVTAASFAGTYGASHGITGRVAGTCCAPLVCAARLEAPGDHYELV